MSIFFNVLFPYSMLSNKRASLRTVMYIMIYFVGAGTYGTDRRNWCHSFPRGHTVTEIWQSGKIILRCHTVWVEVKLSTTWGNMNTYSNYFFKLILYKLYKLNTLYSHLCLFVNSANILQMHYLLEWNVMQHLLSSDHIIPYTLFTRVSNEGI